MEETQDYDKLYLGIRENHIIELNSELADELYDANDEAYVEQKFKEKYHKRYIHYSAFIFNNTRRSDLFKSDLLNKFEDIYRRKNENHVMIFIEEILPDIKNHYLAVRYAPLRKDDIPLFDYDFFKKSDDINFILDYIAKYFAIEKVLSENRNEDYDKNEMENQFNKLNQAQRALFFVYIREAGCISPYKEYGTNKLNGLQNIFNKFNMIGSFIAFKNKLYSFEKKEKRLKIINEENLKAIIPLLIACPKAYDNATRELEHVKQFS